MHNIHNNVGWDLNRGHPQFVLQGHSPLSGFGLCMSAQGVLNIKNHGITTRGSAASSSRQLTIKKRHTQRLPSPPRCGRVTKSGTAVRLTAKAVWDNKWLLMGAENAISSVYLFI